MNVVFMQLACTDCSADLMHCVIGVTLTLCCMDYVAEVLVFTD